MKLVSISLFGTKGTFSLLGSHFRSISPCENTKDILIFSPIFMEFNTTMRNSFNNITKRESEKINLTYKSRIFIKGV